MLKKIEELTKTSITLQIENRIKTLEQLGVVSYRVYQAKKWVINGCVSEYPNQDLDIAYNLFRDIQNYHNA